MKRDAQVRRRHSEERYYRQIMLGRFLFAFLPLNLLLTMIRVYAIPIALLSDWVRKYRRYQRPAFQAMNTIEAFKISYRRIIGRASMNALYVKGDAKIPVDSLVEAIGSEYLMETRRTGRGILLATAHTTGFRLLQLWINQVDPSWEPFLVKLVPDDPSRLWTLKDRQQSRIFNGRIIDAAFPRRIVNMLRTGGSVLLAQDLPHPKAERVEFLGKTMRNPLGAARLVEMSDALILPVTVGPRLDRRKWRIHFLPPIDPREGETKEKLRTAMEELILLYPESWNGWRSLWKTAE